MVNRGLEDDAIAMRMKAFGWRRLLTVLSAALVIVLCPAADSTLNRGQLLSVAQQRYGAPGVEVVNDWLRLIDLARDQPIAVKLSRVNEFFNIRTIFQSDIQVWHQSDYWATPLQTMTKGRGDCEDFAIAKYVTLLELGVSQSQLRLIYVKAMIPGEGAQAHMVLGYFPDPNGEPKILDNLLGSIEWAHNRKDLVPVFSFNSEGLWAGNVKAKSNPTERLSLWRDVLTRMRQEGFL